MESSVLVTGANGGIGHAICTHLERQGVQVIATDVNANSEHGYSNYIQLDLSTIVSSHTAKQAFYQSVLSCLGDRAFRGVVHNAAFQIVTPFEDLTDTDWLATFSVNLFAPVAISRLFLDHLNNSAGSIVHISSVHEQLTKPGFTAYATSKAALSGLTKAMAVELGPKIRVNAIAPAAISTPMLMAGFSQQSEAFTQLEQYHPTGHIGQPAEVARVVEWLLSPKVPFLNGAVIELGGGIHHRLHDPI